MTKPTLLEENISLDEVISSMKQWREKRRAGQSRVIPDKLWLKIFSLAQTYEAKSIRGLLAITKEQYDHKYRQLTERGDHKKEEQASPLPPKAPSVFCEVKMASPYKPSPLPKTATDLAVIEIYRPDKSLLKIHTTAEKIDKIVQSFLAGSGEHHATNHQ